MAGSSSSSAAASAHIVSLGGKETQALWYALVLRSRFEVKADLLLREAGIESFLPLIEEVHIWSDRKKRVQVPLFKGYLFVRTDLRRKVEILQTSGVVRFIEFGGKPVFVPDYQVEWVKLALRQPRNIQREPYYSTGDYVRIVSGPLTGLEGFITETRGHARLVISVSSIAQSFSVELGEDAVRKVESTGKELNAM